MNPQFTQISADCIPRIEKHYLRKSATSVNKENTTSQSYKLKAFRNGSN